MTGTDLVNGPRLLLEIELTRDERDKTAGSARR